mmetsp:Transcript_20575/g.49483  ORF Transcript_20575/g.49483 Transcript_20575/m.49483 type:complete len:108 (+) Transcript_20575:132-455(+)
MTTLAGRSHSRNSMDMFLFVRRAWISQCADNHTHQTRAQSRKPAQFDFNEPDEIEGRSMMVELSCLTGATEKPYLSLRRHSRTEWDFMRSSLLRLQTLKQRCRSCCQ